MSATTSLARLDTRRKRVSTGSSSTARTATSCRASSRRSRTSARTTTAPRSTTAFAIRFEVFGAVREAWPARLPISVHLGARLGGGRHYPRRRGRDRARLQGGRRGHDRLLVGPGEPAAGAGVRPHVARRSRIACATRRSRDAIARWAPSREADRERHPSRRRADLCAIARPHLAKRRVDARRGGTHRLSRRRVAATVSVGEDAARSATSTAIARQRRRGRRYRRSSARRASSGCRP